MKHEELVVKAFEAARAAFSKVAKCADPETGEPSIEDAVAKARSAAVDTVLDAAMNVILNTMVSNYGLAPTACREALANEVGRLRRHGE
jgi:hypothetical protein